MNDLAKRGFSLLPSTFGEAKELAAMMASSEFVPNAFKNKPESVLLAVQMGADVGLKPLQSLQNIAVINGRPSIWGDAALALVMPVLERFQETMEGEGDTLTAVCLAHRKGWPDDTIRRFSVADAKKANLWGKSGPWVNYPNRMLQLRARGFCLRDVGPDMLLGFILAEEAMDLPTEPIPVGASSTVPPKSLAVFLALPEPLRDSVEKAFTTLSFSEAQRLQKLNEFLGGDVVPEEAAEALLSWCRDEFALRRTWQRRAAKHDTNRKKMKETVIPGEAGLIPGEGNLGAATKAGAAINPTRDEASPDSSKTVAGEVLFE